MYYTKGVDVFNIDNIKFHLDKKSGYYQGCVNGKKIRLHQYVWIKYNGDIPKGYHIHHIDKDNLKLLSQNEHLKLHAIEIPKKIKCEILDKFARPKAIVWHGSFEGSLWHSKHGKDIAVKLKNVELMKVCLECGIPFKDNGFNKAKFCSAKCKSKYRRKSGVDDEIKACIICGKEFKFNKYDKTKTCSKNCSNLFRYKNSENKINN